MDSILEPYACEATVLSPALLSPLALTSSPCCIEKLSKLRSKKRFAQPGYLHEVSVCSRVLWERSVPSRVVSRAQLVNQESGQPLAYQYLQQRIPVAMQWGNAVAVLGTSPPNNFDLSTPNDFYFSMQHTRVCIV